MSNAREEVRLGKNIAGKAVKQKGEDAKQSGERKRKISQGERERERERQWSRKEDAKQSGERKRKKPQGEREREREREGSGTWVFKWAVISRRFFAKSTYQRWWNFIKITQSWFDPNSY